MLSEDELKDLHRQVAEPLRAGTLAVVPLELPAPSGAPVQRPCPLTASNLS